MIRRALAAALGLTIGTLLLLAAGSQLAQPLASLALAALAGAVNGTVLGLFTRRRVPSEVSR